MKTLNPLTFTLIALVAGSCGKPPKASFTSDKEEYNNGEYMYMTNTSTNSYSWNWKVSGSLTEYNSKDAKIITNGAGNIVVTLTAYSRNGGKSNKTERTFVVHPGQGQVMYYGGAGSVLPASILVDGVLAGTVTETFSAAPDCGTSGCVTSAVSEGAHIFSIVKNTDTVSSTVLVDPNICKKIKVP